MAASLVTGVKVAPGGLQLEWEEGKIAMTALVESTPFKLYFHPFAAARALGTTQPTVSRRLDGLERRIGAKPLSERRVVCRSTRYS
jgi:hypothetical protein